MKARGLTLMELLCVLAILGVLGGLSLPSWREASARAAVEAAARQMLTGLALARRTALTTGQPVTLCPTRDLLRCDRGGREWMMFVNGAAGALSMREPGEPVLRRWPLPAGVRIGGSRDHVWYLPQTRAAATATFEFCHAGLPALRRQVIVSQTGRPRISGGPSSSEAPSRCP